MSDPGIASKVTCPHCEVRIDTGTDPPMEFDCPSCGGGVRLPGGDPGGSARVCPRGETGLNPAAAQFRRRLEKTRRRENSFFRVMAVGALISVTVSTLLFVFDPPPWLHTRTDPRIPVGLPHVIAALVGYSFAQFAVTLVPVALLHLFGLRRANTLIAVWAFLIGGLVILSQTGRVAFKEHPGRPLREEVRGDPGGEGLPRSGGPASSIVRGIRRD